MAAAVVIGSLKISFHLENGRLLVNINRNGKCDINGEPGYVNDYLGNASCDHHRFDAECNATGCHGLGAVAPIKG